MNNRELQSKESAAGWRSYLASKKRLTPREVVGRLRKFKQPDWYDFLKVLTCESDGVEAIYSAFSLDRNAFLTQSVAEVLSQMELNALGKYERGFDLLLAEWCLQSSVPVSNGRCISHLFLLARMAGVGPSVETLKKIMSRENVAGELRQSAALTLADYSGAADFAFWRDVAYSSDPLLWPVGLLYLSTSENPYEVFLALAKCPRSNLNQEAVRLSIEAALRQFNHREGEALGELYGTLSSLPEDAHQIVWAVLGRDRFKELRDRLQKFRVLSGRSSLGPEATAAFAHSKKVELPSFGSGVSRAKSDPRRRHSRSDRAEVVGPQCHGKAVKGRGKAKTRYPKKALVVVLPKARGTSQSSVRGNLSKLKLALKLKKISKRVAKKVPHGTAKKKSKNKAAARRAVP